MKLTVIVLALMLCLAACKKEETPPVHTYRIESGNTSSARIDYHLNNHFTQFGVSGSSFIYEYKGEFPEYLSASIEKISPGKYWSVKYYEDGIVIKSDSFYNNTNPPHDLAISIAYFQENIHR